VVAYWRVKTDVKKIIRTYVERVNVYVEHVKVFLVVHTNGGVPYEKKFT
jgi:trehalose-6-phosphatase